MIARAEEYFLLSILYSHSLFSIHPRNSASVSASASIQQPLPHSYGGHSVDSEGKLQREYRGIYNSPIRTNMRP